MQRRKAKSGLPRVMPARKRRMILNDIMESILDGSYAPGSRLPTRRELEARYQSSTITVQTALDQLRRDGFVYTDRRNGTFVAQVLPCDTRFALAFPHVDRSGPNWSLFYQALETQVALIERETEYRFPLYYGVDEEPEENSVRRKLLDDTRNHRLAGVVLAHPPRFLGGTELLTGDGTACVVLGQVEGHTWPCVVPDQTAMLNLALDVLEQAGRKRIAVIMPAVSTEPINHEERLNRILAARGMQIPSCWKLQVPLHPASAARDIAHLLMSQPPDVRPDGLLIADDNVVDAVCAGLMSAGVFGTGALDVVAHSNFTAEAPRYWPVRRMGSDPRAILNTCIKIILMQRRGETPPLVTMLPPVLEDLDGVSG